MTDLLTRILEHRQRVAEYSHSGWLVNGVALFIAGLVWWRDAFHAVPLIVLMVAIASTLFFGACAHYAVGRGHSQWWGLVGVFNVVGLAVVSRLPDRIGDDVDQRRIARIFE